MNIDCAKWKNSLKLDVTDGNWEFVSECREIEASKVLSSERRGLYILLKKPPVGKEDSARPPAGIAGIVVGSVVVVCVIILPL